MPASIAFEMYNRPRPRLQLSAVVVEQQNVGRCWRVVRPRHERRAVGGIEGGSPERNRLLHNGALVARAGERFVFRADAAADRFARHRDPGNAILRMIR